MITKKPALLTSQGLAKLRDEYQKLTHEGREEVADRLHIHPESVRRLIRQGKLPAIKFGNKWLVEKSSLEQFAGHYDPRPGNKATLL